MILDYILEPPPPPKKICFMYVNSYTITDRIHERKKNVKDAEK